MTVLITGGTGFIGSRLAQACLAAGDSVRVTGQSRNPVEAETCEILAAAGASVEVASITDRARVAELVTGIDVVYHLAAAQHEANVADRHFEEVNVDGTRNLVEAAAAAGVARFVHGSTIGVYRWSPDAPVNERSPLEPDNIYGRTKLAGEGVVRSGSEIAWTIARISEVYGPGDHRLLKLFRGIQKGFFPLFGGGSNLHHLIFVDDLIQALRRAANSDAAIGQTYVLAGPRPVSTREMAEAAAAALGCAPPKLSVPLWPVMLAAAGMETVLRPLGIQPPLHRRRMDFFRKSFAFRDRDGDQLLSWKPEVELEQGMRATAGWYAEQGLLTSGESH